MLGISVIGLAAIAWASFVEVAPRLVYNASTSLPMGFYRVMPIDDLRRGDLVVVPVPERHQSLALERGYLDRGVNLIKRVASLRGDHVCALDRVISINGTAVARSLKRDSAGRRMPVWTGCRTLREGEFFALIGEVDASFDGRYFGPMACARIVGKAVPAWTF